MDVFFNSFKESNCEENWKNVLSFHPNAIRLHGIKGINTVHILCDEIAKTDHFWTIDGDNFLTEQLIYDGELKEDLIMFKAIDPLYNNLTLLGGVKLWKKGKIIEKTMESGDFTLNATKKKSVVDKSYSITKYNDSPFDAWKTAFRHCVKLNSIIFENRPYAKNIDNYILQWKNSKSTNQKNCEWAYKGYIDAIKYTDVNHSNMTELQKINDYNWLEDYFRKINESS